MQYTMQYISAAGDSLTFSLKSGLIITDFSLLSGLPVTISTSQSISQIGGTVESQLIDPRSSTVKGFIRGNGVEGKRRLLSVIRPLEKAKILVNGQYSMDVYVSDTPAVERENMFPQFEFGVTAPYPFWQSTSETVTPMAGITGMFQFPWNLTQPYKFGELLSSYFTSVYNAGQVPTGFDLEISASGPAKNPVFEEINTGDMLKLNKALETGERVTVSIKNDGLTAISNIDGDIEGLIDIDSTLFSLRAGDNVIRYDADSGRENLSVSIRFSNKYAGVVV